MGFSLNSSTSFSLLFFKVDGLSLNGPFSPLFPTGRTSLFRPPACRVSHSTLSDVMSAAKINLSRCSLRAI